MKDYTNNTPEFSEIIKILETTDPGHADILNEPLKKLFQNTLVIRDAIQELIQDLSALQTELGDHTHSADDITSGTLAVERGGNGGYILGIENGVPYVEKIEQGENNG